ncbi:hypothetical protein [Acetobacter aceti]|uniref:hypothetical protein n=1 Tax=Acetobacter aceti TaxID=435 RepID=UPI002F2B2EB3
MAGLSATCGQHLVHGSRRGCLGQSQANSEQADIVREKQEFLTDWDREVAELAAICQKRGQDTLAHMPGTN